MGRLETEVKGAECLEPMLGGCDSTQKCYKIGSEGPERSNIIPLTEPEIGVPSVLRPGEDTTRYFTIMRSRQDLITTITTVCSLMFWLQLSFLGNKRTRLLKPQGGNPDSRVFPQKQREA